MRNLIFLPSLISEDMSLVNVVLKILFQAYMYLLTSHWFVVFLAVTIHSYMSYVPWVTLFSILYCLYPHVLVAVCTSLKLPEMVSFYGIKCTREKFIFLFERLYKSWTETPYCVKIFKCNKNRCCKSFLGILEIFKKNKKTKKKSVNL